MSRSELVRLSGVSKQQLSRLENGQIRLRLDHLKPFANHLGYTPEQILLWGRYPGTGSVHIESSDVLREDPANEEPLGPSPGQVPELDTRAGLGGGGMPARELRKDGRHADPLKTEGWLFPAEFRARTIAHFARPPAGARHHWRQHGADHRVGRTRDRRHRPQDADARRALRDPRHLREYRGQAAAGAALGQPAAGEDHFRQSKSPEEETPLGELEIVGKVLCCLKLF